jgi:aryl-alcohol dehydrogenase-like predicted oxidoreductase
LVRADALERGGVAHLARRDLLAAADQRLAARHAKPPRRPEQAIEEAPAKLRLAQGADIIPIPGTKHRCYLQENVGALTLKLSAGDLRRIEEAFPRGAASGSRYPEHMMALINT